MKAQRLRFIFGDQLNCQHSWFRHTDNNTLYVIAELQQEAGYVAHHIQKVSAFFAAMQAFAQHLQDRGHRVLHLTLDDTAKYPCLELLLSQLIKQYAVTYFDYQRPDEFRLLEQMRDFAQQQSVSVSEVDSEHFLLPFAQLSQYFTANKHVRMESFYRKMRKRFDVLMEGDKPAGGAWNYDQHNRQSFKAADLHAIPQPLLFENDLTVILQRIKQHNIVTLGTAENPLGWPINREQSLALLRYFCQFLLPLFGTFQDAMTSASPYDWSLYHSRLSFSLNSKMLTPKEVIDTALAAYKAAAGAISLAQVEGFIRQILGWREYVRGMYWANMPAYQQQNHLAANKALPNWFWTGKTHMQCMHKAITQSLQHAYAHHIQRLMITGNFALLAGLQPAQVDDWYLGIYIDAIQWVELPNTRGMALFADGGWIATKPYAASGNYINKMSDYCKGCRYQVKQKTGLSACPFNALYWNFIDKHLAQFSHNQRMAFVVKNWLKMKQQDKEAIRSHAANLLNSLEQL